MSTLVASTITADTLTNQDSQLCKAYISYHGTANTYNSSASYNVSSVTDVGTGQFEINLITPMSNTDYAVVASLHNSTTDSSGFTNGRYANCAFPYTTSIVRLTGYRNDTNGFVDHSQYGVAVFGN